MAAYGAGPSASAPKTTFLVSGEPFDVGPRFQLAAPNPLGSGAYGVVAAFRDEQNGGRKVAIKKYKKFAFQNLTDLKRILREIRLLRHLKHPNIVDLVDVLITDERLTFKELYMVTEQMDTDLHHIIHSKQRLTDEHCKVFLHQMLLGLKYLKSANVVHRDLKPGNILVNADCKLKICDFGLARILNAPAENYPTDHMLTQYVVTRWYRAPEIMLNVKDYDYSIDIWSVGCIFAELLGRKAIFRGDNYLHMLKLITEMVGKPTAEDLTFVSHPKAREYMSRLPVRNRLSFSQLYPDANPLAVDLLENMLQFSPTKRITVEAALRHPYLAAMAGDPAENVSHAAGGLGQFEFEHQELSSENLRAQLWGEQVAFHPEKA